MKLPGHLRRAVEVWVGIPDVPAARRWALVMIIDSIGTGMFLPVSVLYLNVVVGLPLRSIGVGLGIAGLLATVASPIAGALVDRLGAKTMVVALLLLAAIGYVGYLGVHDWTSFVVVACVTQVADYAARPAKKVFVTTIVSGDKRLPLMAFQRAVRNAGFGIGGLITAGLLVVGSSGYHVVLAADAISYLVGALLVLTIKVLPPAGSTKSAPTSSEDAVKASKRDGYRQVLRDKRYLALVVLNILVHIYATAFSIGMPLWLHRHASLPSSFAGLLFTLNTVLVVVLQVRLTRGYAKVDQAYRLYIQTAGTFILAAVGYWAAYRLSDVMALAVVMVVIAVLAHTLTELYGAVAEWIVSVNLAPERLRGRYLSLFSLSMAAHQAVGPGLVTALMSADPDVAWFGLAGVLALGCLASAQLVKGAVEPDDEGEAAGSNLPVTSVARHGSESGTDDIEPAVASLTPHTERSAK